MGRGDVPDPHNLYVCVVVGWKNRGLLVSQLEIGTVAFGTCATIIHRLNWHKPKAVRSGHVNSTSRIFPLGNTNLSLTYMEQTFKGRYAHTWIILKTTW